MLSAGCLLFAQELTTVRLMEGGHFLMCCPSCGQSLLLTKDLYTLLSHYKPPAVGMHQRDRRIPISQVSGQTVILQVPASATFPSHHPGHQRGYRFCVAPECIARSLCLAFLLQTSQ